MFIEYFLIGLILASSIGIFASLLLGHLDPKSNSRMHIGFISGIGLIASLFMYVIISSENEKQTWNYKTINTYDCKIVEKWDSPGDFRLFFRDTSITVTQRGLIKYDSAVVFEVEITDSTGKVIKTKYNVEPKYQEFE